MKTLAVICLAAAAIGALSQPKSAHRAKILGINSEIQPTPEIRFSGPRDKPMKPRHWLEIEAEIEVETTDPSGFIPELRANWYAVVMDRHAEKPVRLLGSSTFQNVRTRDRKVFLSAYIEPDTLERFTGKSKPSDSDIEGFALTLSGPRLVSDGRYAADLVLATAEADSRWWVDWKHQSLEGMIVPKSRTPFAVLWTARYPAEKIRE